MATVKDVTISLTDLTSRLSQTPPSDPSSPTPEDRKELLAAAKGLVATLEGPEVATWRVVYGPQAHAVLSTAFKMGLFEAFGVERGVVRTAEGLAVQMGVEKLLLVRILRGLVVSGFFVEVDEEKYVHNEVSIRFANPVFKTFMVGMSSITQPYMPKLPDYLARIGYHNPDDAQNTLFHYAMGSKLNLFEWMQNQPDELAIFSACMAASSVMGRAGLQAAISGLFPAEDVASNVGESADVEEQVLLVDVGGGRGKIWEDVRSHRPDLKGRMIVQDLPQEINHREKSDGVEGMAHDFFTPQPVIGAHTYFFRHVLHDWSDSACRTILGHTVQAMTRGRSRVIIFDAVLPNKGAPVFGTFLDIGMMVPGGLERTERHWRELLSGVGLKVVSIAGPPGGRGSDSIIEAVLD